MAHALITAWLGAGFLLAVAQNLLGRLSPMFSNLGAGLGREQLVLAVGLITTLVIVGAILLTALRVGVGRKTRAVQKQLSEQTVLRERAEAANQAKADFLATMGHE